MGKLNISQELFYYLKEMAKTNKIADLLISNLKDELINDHIDFLSVSEDDSSKISYLTSDRMDNLKISEYFIGQKRYHTKPGKALRKLFLAEFMNDNISNQDLELFGNMYKSLSCFKGKDIKVVKGEELRKYYLGKHYKSGGGSLNSSCMRSKIQQGYLDLYCHWPELVSMIVLFDPEDDKIFCRALLWKCKLDCWNEDKKVMTGMDITFMDRIYCVNECDYEVMKKYADDHNYFYKLSQSYHDKETIMIPTAFIDKFPVSRRFKSNSSFYVCSTLSIFFPVDKKRGCPEYWPYVDTLSYQCMDEKGFFLYNNPDGVEWALECTGGGRMDGDGEPEEDSVYSDYYSENIHEDQARWSEYHDSHMWSEDVTWLEHKQDYVVHDKAHEFCSFYYLTEDCVHSSFYDDAVPTLEMYVGEDYNYNQEVDDYYLDDDFENFMEHHADSFENEDSDE